MKRCEECNQLKDQLECLVEYLNDDMSIIEERKTCRDCYFKYITKLRVIGRGPNVKKNGIKYLRINVVGEPISGQLELF